MTELPRAFPCFKRYYLQSANIFSTAAGGTFRRAVARALNINQAKTKRPRKIRPSKPNKTNLHGRVESKEVEVMVVDAKLLQPGF